LLVTGNWLLVGRKCGLVTNYKQPITFLPLRHATSRTSDYWSHYYSIPPAGMSKGVGQKVATKRPLSRIGGRAFWFWLIGKCKMLNAKF
jgi:hypothetical protein